MNISLEAKPALVLNADFRPMSYLPLSLWHWQDVVRAVFLDRVTILEEYRTRVHAAEFSMRLPSVIALKDYIKPRKNPAFTRFNLFLRDGFCCQYCGGKFKTHELTFDHVVPRAAGGQTLWDNVVAACSPCNMKKGCLLPNQSHTTPLRQPYAPSFWELQEIGRHYPPHNLHEGWRDYLYWNVELER